MGSVPRAGLLSVHRRCLRLVQGPPAGVARARLLLLNRIRTIFARVDDRGAERGLRPHRRAKGLKERTVTLKHALRAAVVPVVTIFGLDFAAILAGTIFTEKIFQIHGIGLQALESIGNKDLPMISATVLIAATFVVIMNIIVDLAHAALDPRVRLSGRAR